jgi:hypothetical protein
MNDRVAPFDDEPAPPASLREAQGFLSGAIQSPSTLGERRDLHDGVRAIAKGSARLPAIGQVDVYREQFWLRHVASLAEDFPTVKHVLGGDGPFATLCERYLAAHPPSDFLMRNLSARMPEFLSADPRYAGDTLLADCARAEWAFIDAYDAADPEPFDPTPLAGAGEEALFAAKLVMQAPLRLIAMEHPAHEFRDAVRAGKAPPRPEPRAVRLAIFRAGEELRCFELEPAAFDVVAALLGGAPLGEACDRAIRAGADESELGAKLGQWFSWWTQWGWLTKIELAG